MAFNAACFFYVFPKTTHIFSTTDRQFLEKRRDSPWMDAIICAVEEVGHDVTTT